MLKSRTSGFSRSCTAFSFFFTILVIPFLLWSCRSNDQNPAAVPLSDSARHESGNALAGLDAAEDLDVHLFAHEPMVINPTNFDIDEKGRVWVCEGYNYRNQFNPQNPYRPEGDRIVILEDTTGDGIADKETVFYQGRDVDAALGIAVLGNRVIVSCSPNVFIFTDENGDGKADRKDTLFTAIGGFQHDHAIHSFNFGPDGKLYFNFGNEGHSIRTKDGREIKDLSGKTVNNSGNPFRQGMAFRCNPDGSEFEVLGNNFRNNYEISEDSYGTLWQSDNDDDGNRGVRINYVMQYGNYGYTDERTGAHWSEHRINMEDSIPFRHWHLNDPGVVPNLLQTGAGSPTGILIYEGDLLPKRFQGQIIHSDAGPNVVRSYAVSADGAGYRASINNIVEAKRDDWFRPSDVCVAPDGSLFIADWYDPGVGGHQVRDLSRGRIFRVVPKGFKGYQIPKIDWSSTEGQIEGLKSPNLSTRYHAWQLLHEKGEGAQAALEGLFHDGNSRFRARALWLMSKIPSKGLDIAREALKDSHQDIRITALRAICEQKGDTLAAVGKLVDDPVPAVRREAALALRHCFRPEASAAWSRLAAHYDGADRWYLEALGISSDGRESQDFQAWLAKVGTQWNSPAGKNIVWRARTPMALPYLAKILEDPKVNPKDQLKYFRSFDFIQAPNKNQVLLGLMAGHHPQQNIMDEYALLCLDPVPANPDTRMNAWIDSALMASAGSREYVVLVKKFKVTNKSKELLDLAVHAKDPDLQTEALKVLLANGGQAAVLQKIAAKDADASALVRALGDIESHPTKKILEDMILDPHYDDSWKLQALHALGNDWTGEDMLLQMARAGKIPEKLRDSVGKILLAASRDSIQKGAAPYFANLSKATTTHLDPVEKLVGLKGNALLGKTVFASYCASCHRVNNEGINFGPNLSEIGSKLSKEALYAAILQPSSGISFGYEGFIFTLKSGVKVVGYVASETGQEISIKKIGGITEKHLKTEVVDKQPYGKSLMTEGLPQAMGQNKLVDLVEYLKTLKTAIH